MRKGAPHESPTIKKRFLLAALAASTFTLPGAAIAQDRCAGLSPGGRRTCYAVSGYNTRQEAFKASARISQSIATSIDAKQYAAACSSAISLEQLALAYLPELHLRALEVKQLVCRVAN